MAGYYTPEEAKKRQEQRRKKAEAQRASASSSAKANREKKAQVLTQRWTKRSNQAADTLKRMGDKAPKITREWAGYANPTMRRAGYSWSNKTPDQMDFIEQVAYGRLNPQLKSNQGYWDALKRESQTVGHAFYNPYLGNQSTQTEAMEFFGVDKFDEQWFKENQHLRNHVTRLPVTDSISTAGKNKWTREQWAGYYYENLLMDEEQTRKAESQWKQLQADAQDWFDTRKAIAGEAPSVEDFLAHVDVKRYSELLKMDESRNIGEAGSSKVVRLNRPVGYSREALYGLYDALAQGNASQDQDFYQAAIGYFMKPRQVRKEAPKALYAWQAQLPNMSDEQKRAEEQRIRSSGSRGELDAWRRAQFAASEDGYFGGMMKDAAFFERYDPVFGPIIEGMRAYDPNGSGKVERPGTDATEMQKAAYEYYQIRSREVDTRAVEDEWAGLVELIRNYAEDYGDDSIGYLTDEADNPIDDYLSGTTLKRWLDNPENIQLNRPVYASKEALERMIELAGKGVDISSPEVDYAVASESILAPRNAVETGKNEADDAPATDSQGFESEAEKEARPAGPLDNWKMNLDRLPEKLWRLPQEAGLLTQSEIDTYREYRQEQTPAEHTGMVPGAFEPQSSMAEEPGSYTPDELHTYLAELKAALERAQSGDEIGAMWQDKYVYEIGQIEQALTDMGEPLKQPATLHTDGGEEVRVEGADLEALPKWSDERKASDDDRVEVSQAPAAPLLDADLMGVAASAGLLSDEDTALVEPQSLYDLDADAAARWADYLHAEADYAQASIGVELPDAYDAIQARIWALEDEKSVITERVLMGEMDSVAFADQLAELTSEADALVAQQAYAQKLLVARDTADAYLTEGERPIWTRGCEWHQRAQSLMSLFDVQTWENAKDTPQMRQALASGEAIEKIISGEDVEAGLAYFQEAARQAQEAVGNLDKELDVEADRILGANAPDWQKFLFKGFVIDMGAAETGVVQGLGGVVSTGANLVRECYLKINEARYEQQLGEGYTLEGVRAIDPFADTLTQIIDGIEVTTDASAPDMSQAGYGAGFIQGGFKNAVEMYAYNKIGKGAVGLFNKVIVEKAIPFLKELPSAMEKIGKAIAQGGGRLIQFSPYMVRSYADYANTAREEGYGEEEAAAYGWFGAWSQGTIEGVLGGAYEKIGQLIPNTVSKVAQRIVQKGGGKLVQSIGDVFKAMGAVVGTALGEGLEEATEVPVEDIGRKMMLKQDVDFTPYRQALSDIVTGQFDLRNYEGTKVVKMWDNGVAGFGSAIVASILFGLGGGDADFAARSEQMAFHLAGDPEYQQAIEQAFEYMAGDEDFAAPMGDQDMRTEAKMDVQTQAQPVTSNEIALDAAPQAAGNGVEPAPLPPKAREIVQYVKDAESAVKESVIEAETEAAVEQIKAEGFSGDVMSPASADSKNIIRLQSEMQALVGELQSLAGQVQVKDAAIADVIRTALGTGMSIEAGTVKQSIHNLNEAKAALVAEFQRQQKKADATQAEMQNAIAAREVKAEEQDRELRKEKRAEIEQKLKDFKLSFHVQRALIRQEFTQDIQSGANVHEATERYLDTLTTQTDADPQYESIKSVEAPPKEDDRRDDAVEPDTDFVDADRWVPVDKSTYEAMLQMEQNYAVKSTDDPMAASTIDMSGYDTRYEGGETDTIAQLTRGLGENDQFREIGRNQVYLIVEDAVAPDARLAEVQQQISQLRAVYNRELEQAEAERQEIEEYNRQEIQRAESKRRTEEATIRFAQAIYDANRGDSAALDFAQDQEYTTPELKPVPDAEATLNGMREQLYRLEREAARLDRKGPGYDELRQAREAVLAIEKQISDYKLELLTYDLHAEHEMTREELKATIGQAVDELAATRGRVTQLEKRLGDQTGKYLVINLTTAPQHRDQAIELRTADLAAAVAYANRLPQNRDTYHQRLPHSQAYYVRESKLWQWAPSMANNLVAQGAARSYEEYVDATKAVIDRLALRDGMTEDEKRAMLEQYTFKSRMARYDEDYVDVDRSEQFVLVTRNDNYPGMKENVNAGLDSVENALSIIRAALRDQERDRNREMGALASYHDPAYKQPKTSITAARDRYYNEKREGKSYPREGEIKYTVMEPSGRKATYTLGAWIGGDQHRYYASYEDIIGSASAIHVNRYQAAGPGPMDQGSKVRYTFTLEANHGQGSNKPAYPGDEPMIGAARADVVKEYERAYSAWAGATLNPAATQGELLPLLRNVTLRKLDVLDRARTGLEDRSGPEAAAKLALLNAQREMLEQLYQSVFDKAGGASGPHVLDELLSPKPEDLPEQACLCIAQLTEYINAVQLPQARMPTIEQRCVYQGYEEDCRKLMNLARRYDSIITDGVSNNRDEAAGKVFAEATKLTRAIQKKLRDARAGMGGGALLSEYNARAGELRREIAQAKAAAMEDDTKLAILRVKRGELRKVNAKIDSLRKRGITLDTPGRFDSEIKIAMPEESTPRETGTVPAERQALAPEGETVAREPPEEEITDHAAENQTPNQPDTGDALATPRTIVEMELADKRTAREIVDEVMALTPEQRSALEAMTNEPDISRSPDNQPPSGKYRVTAPRPTGSMLRDKTNALAFEAERKAHAEEIRETALRDMTPEAKVLNSPEDTAPLAGQEAPDTSGTPVPDGPTNEEYDPLNQAQGDIVTITDAKKASRRLQRIEAQIKWQSDNLDRLAAKAKDGPLSAEDQARKAELIARRAQYKKARDQTIEKIKAPAAQAMIKKHQIVEDAMDTGMAAPSIPHMRNAAIAQAAKENDAWLDARRHIMRDGKLTALSDDEIISWMGAGDTETKLIENLEIANALSHDVHQLEERLAIIERGIDALRAEIEALPAGDEGAGQYARLARLQESRYAVADRIVKGKAAANEYYRDGANNLREVLSGKRGGRLPISVMNKVIAIAQKASTGKGANPTKFLARNFGNAKQVVESYFGEDAPMINKLFVQPVVDANAEIAKAREGFNERIKASGITAENSRIAHQYAEGVIDADALRHERPDDWQTVIKGIEVFRQAYDDLLDQVNAALARNGYDPVPKRENYFPHFREDASTIDVVTGKDIDDYTLKTSLYGRSGEFRPGKQFNPHFLRRQGEDTVYDLLRGYEHYIDGALQVIHQTDNIVRLRRLEEELRLAFDINADNISKTRMGNFTRWVQEYANTLAGKKGSIDYAAEGLLSRRLYTALNAIKATRGTALIVGNLSVAISNFIPMGQALSFAPQETAAAAMTMIGNLRYGKEFFTGDGFEASSAFLTRRFQGRAMDLSWWEAFQDKAQMPAEFIDRLAANVVVRSVYRQGINKGYSPEIAMQRADDIAWRMMANRARGESGAVQSSQTGGVFLQFAREPINNLFYMFKDLPQLDSGTKYPVALALIALFDWAFNWLTNKNTAFDPLGAGQKTIQAMDDDSTVFSVGGDLIKNLWDTGWPVGETAPIVSGFTNAVDAVGGVLTQPDAYTAWENLGSAVMGWVPGGAQAERMYRGGKMIWKGYSESKQGYYRFAFDDANAVDKLSAVILGESATSQGKAFSRAGGKPMTKAQDQAVRAMMDAGMPPSEAEGNVRHTPDAQAFASAATDAQKRGDRATRQEQSALSKEARQGITVPSGLPAWATAAHQEPYMQRAIGLWQAYGDTAILPKSIPDVLDSGGKRADLAPEDRSAVEAEYQRNYRAALNRLPEDAGLKEVKKELERAYKLVVNKYIKAHYGGD